ncbi:MFS general substrate transporter [Ephemerocybe angulata]|uniref:MFS general substrate transporter n=1 Tax=Ephemerocybe angulata TaxID=980116 RepID=A0A8H6HUM4_9AGAR|nr:MFS general substrate transporter [Tulosesus angulatus]
MDPEKSSGLVSEPQSPLNTVTKALESPTSTGFRTVVVDDKEVWRKVDRRLLPALAVMYLFSFMDRANIGNARLQGLEKQLNMSGDQYNLALTLFFVPYCICEFPSNLIIKKFRPSRWLPLITVVWGLIVVVTGFVRNFPELLAARLLLGVAEAGFFPGVVYYLSLWYPRYMYQTRIAWFFGAASMAGAFSGLFAYAIGFMDGWRGLKGWSWIFIIEGTLTVLVGIAAYFMMVDLPATATFLTPDERQFVLDSQRLYATSLGEEEHFELRHVWDAITDWQVYIFVFISLGFVTPLYGITFFSPTIINSFGYTPAITQLLSIPPYVVATICVYIWAHYSDKLQLRSPFLLIALVVSFIGYAINISNAPVAVKYFGIFFCVTGSYGGIPGLVSRQGNNTSGQYKRAIALALHIGFANFGGAIGSGIFRKRDSPRFLLGFGIELMLIGLSMIAICVIVLTYRRINSRRDEIQRGEAGVRLGNDVLEERRRQGDKAVDFRYAL